MQRQLGLTLLCIVSLSCMVYNVPLHGYIECLVAVATPTATYLHQVFQEGLSTSHI